MSDLNSEEAVRLATAALESGDTQTLRNYLTDDVVCHIPGLGPFAGHHAGLDAVLRITARIQRHRQRYPVKTTVVATSCSRTHLAISTLDEASRNGKDLRWHTKTLYFFRGERIAACWLFAEEADVFDAYWAAGAKKASTGSNLLPGFPQAGLAGA